MLSPFVSTTAATSIGGWTEMWRTVSSGLSWELVTYMGDLTTVLLLAHTAHHPRPGALEKVMHVDHARIDSSKPFWYAFTSSKRQVENRS